MKNLKHPHIAFMLIGGIFLAGCNQQDSYFSKSPDLSVPNLEQTNTSTPPDDEWVEILPPVVLPPDDPVADTPPTSPPDRDIVCDPLAQSGSNAGHQYGLKAILYDGSNLSSGITNFNQLLQGGNQAEADVYMSKLYVPTRSFSEGFMVSGGGLLQNASGSPLVENFGLLFSSQFNLASDDEEGYYEVSVLGDDGFKLEVDSNRNGSYDTYLQYNNVTPTRMVCSSQVVRLERGQPIPFKLSYFQGPKYHIALVMVWRKVANLNDHQGALANKTSTNDSLCNHAGNNYFFNPNAGSAPTANFNALLNRENPWRVLESENFLLPQGQNTNPCSDL